MKNPIQYLYLIIMFSCLSAGCTLEIDPPLFNKLPADHTGITFVNTIKSSDSLNVQNYPFLYNGGGVAVGDINNDGLPDLFFTGNQVSSRLYLNKGNMQFEDITESAEVVTNRWASGASMVDINGNGYLDIYISVAGPGHLPAEERANLLFINNGDETFTESAAEFNLDDTSFTTHAAFLDYNRNGHLDVFLLNNSPVDFTRGMITTQSFNLGKGSSVSFDKLYRNNGNGTFTDVSREVGLLEELGYGLGVVVSDLNRDGWPDIYISNDIQPNDVLYINNADGTFSDKSSEWLKHTSFAGMGIDIADFNNDGWPDILQVDMMPEDPSERKRISGSTTYSTHRDLINQGFHYQYSLNTLQLSNGIQANGDLMFSEIARQGGVAYTHWSWSALFADFDNDGHKDIFITNGYPKAVNDFDYLSEMENARRAGDRRKEQELRILEDLHSFEVPNYLFRNEGDLVFTDKSESWGLDELGFSYGAVYADLNNNGRLDLVINNINTPASVYENMGHLEEPTHYLQVRLKGEPSNLQGIGSRVVLTAGGEKQYLYQSPYRGYQSSMDDRLHFGLGDVSQIDSLEVFWPDGRSQLFTEVQSNQLFTVDQQDAGETKRKQSPEEDSPKRFNPLDSDTGISWRHRENDYFIDYNVQPLLPHMLSREGPALAVGDVTNNGLDDVYVGGAAEQAGKLFLQQSDGEFIESSHLQPWEQDRDHEDVDALFFDATGNGLLDLYVVSGGNETSHVSLLLQDRLYINQGNGRFLKPDTALPQMITSGSVVTAGDFTGNGLPDLFVGGRLVPRDYPSLPRSYLLRNDGGRFTDITELAAPALVEAGMITDAVWIDIDEDGRQDLVTTGIWLPIQFYRNDGDQLHDITDSIGFSVPQGWWYSLAKGDFNNNGHMDLVAGNLGLNHTFTATRENPFGLYAADFNGNRKTDLIFTYQENGKIYPFFGFAKLGMEIYQLTSRFRSFEAFSDAPISQIFSSNQLNNAHHFEAESFASVYLQNNGDETYTANKLPAQAQIFPVKSILPHDVDGDGNLDLILAGNIYNTHPEIPRMDAGNGLWLRGNGSGEFKPISPFKSGFLAPQNARELGLIQTSDGYIVIVANNNELLQMYSIRE